jgi:hypothetical protein
MHPTSSGDSAAKFFMQDPPYSSGLAWVSEDLELVGWDLWQVAALPLYQIKAGIISNGLHSELFFKLNQFYLNRSIIYILQSQKYKKQLLS